MDRIKDNVYIASYAGTEKFLEREWDQSPLAILSIGDFENPRWTSYHYNIDHLHIGNVTDDAEREFSKRIPDITGFIDKQNKRKPRVIVHCHAGLNRSASAIVAWLVDKKGMRVSDAISFVESKHPTTNIWNELRQAIQKTLGESVYEDVMVRNKKSGTVYSVNRFNPKTQEKVKARKTKSTKQGKFDKLRKQEVPVETDFGTGYSDTYEPEPMSKEELREFGFKKEEELLDIIGFGNFDLSGGKFSVYVPRRSDSDLIRGKFLRVTARIKIDGAVIFCERHIGKDAIENTGIEIKGKKAGVGTLLLLQEAETAFKKGKKKIVTHACGQGRRNNVGSWSGSGMNGYYTWARLGYEPTNLIEVKTDLFYALDDEIPIDDEKPGKDVVHLKRMKEKIKKMKSMKEIMADPETRQIWKDFGGEFDGEFVLTKANIAYLRAYAKAKGYTK